MAEGRYQEQNQTSGASALRFPVIIPYSLSLGAAASFCFSIFGLQLFSGLLFLVWVFERYSAKRRAFDLLTAVFLVFVLLRISSVFLSEYYSVSAETFYKNLLFFLSIFSFSFYLKYFEFERVKTLFAVYVGAASLSAVFHIVWFIAANTPRATSPLLGNALLDPQMLAGLAILFGLPKERNIKSELLRAVQAALLFSYIITALGRTDMILAGALVLAGVLIRAFSFRSFLLFLLFSGIFLSSAFTLNTNNILRKRVDNPASLSERDILWGAAFEKIGEHPYFGFGPRTFNEVFPYRDQLKDKRIGGWHNLFISVYMESGMFALLSIFGVFALAFLRGAWTAWQNSRKKKNNLKEETVQTSEENNMLLGLLLALSVLFLTSMTNELVNDPFTSVLLTLVLAGLSRFIAPAGKQVQ